MQISDYTINLSMRHPCYSHYSPISRTGIGILTMREVMEIAKESVCHGKDGHGKDRKCYYCTVDVIKKEAEQQMAKYRAQGYSGYIYKHRRPNTTTFILRRGNFSYGQRDFDLTVEFKCKLDQIIKSPEKMTLNIVSRIDTRTSRWDSFRLPPVETKLKKLDLNLNVEEFISQLKLNDTFEQYIKQHEVAALEKHNQFYTQCRETVGRLLMHETFEKPVEDTHADSNHAPDHSSHI